MFKKIILPYGKHGVAFLCLYLPLVTNEKSSILIFLTHGGFFKPIYGLDGMEPLAEDLVNEGYTVVNIEYPRVGDGYTAEQMITTVFELFRDATELKEIEVGIRKTVVIGHSAGGYYALMLLLQNELPKELRIEGARIPDVAIALAPISDLWLAHTKKLSSEGTAIYNFVNEGRSDEAPRELYEKLNPIRYPLPKHSKLILVHGYDDEDVPFLHSCEYRDVHPHCHLLDGAWTHMDLISPGSASWSMTKTFLHDAVLVS